MNTKKLKIDWLDNCPKCERSTVTVSTVKGSLEKLFDGDKVECCGEETEQNRIGSPFINEFLNRIFDEEYEEAKADAEETE